jgi:hypothetical protein
VVPRVTVTDRFEGPVMTVGLEEESLEEAAERLPSKLTDDDEDVSGDFFLNWKTLFACPPK